MATPPLAPPVDLSHYYSQSTKNHTASNIKKFYRFFQIPGIGNLAGGLPNVSLFPYDTLEAQIAKPERWTPTPNEPESELASKLSEAKISKKPDTNAASHITVPKTLAESNPLQKIDLSTALQYGTAEGYPPLRSFVRQFAVEHLHPNVPYLGGPEVILTTGSTDGFAKATEMLVEPWSLEAGDSIENRPSMLTEVFVYMNAPANVRPKGVRIVPVEIDGQGMMAKGPGGLQDVMENWDLKNGRRPHLLYTVSIGHNPTSGILSVKRRKEIYEVCCRYDIVIIEDDPYWYLQFPSAANAEATSRGLPAPEITEEAKETPVKSSGYEFLDSLTPSFLSVDYQGRVIRLDTFSKTIAPGCRLGWITAQPALIERLLRITETNTQQPSGFVQSVVAETVMGAQQPTAKFNALSAREKASFSGWQMDGWVRWLAGLRGVYERRMTRMCNILDDNAFQLKQSTPIREDDADWGVITKTRLISFDWPRGGMFIWIRIHLESHPLFQVKGNNVPVLDGPMLSMALMMFLTHKPHLVLAAPGSMFSATPEVLAERGWRFMRVCFAAEADDVIEPCAHRFANAVQKFFRIKKVEDMEELITEATADEVEIEGITNLGYPLGC